jgi:hypothetical protein
MMTLVLTGVRKAQLGHQNPVNIQKVRNRVNPQVAAH